MTINILLATLITGLGGAHAAFGLQFVLFVAVSTLLTATVYVYSRRQMAIVPLAFLGVNVAVAIASTRESGTPRVDSPNGPPGLEVAAGADRVQAAGERLFRDLGCLGCHRPDGTGMGPVLIGRFGTPVADQGCGALTVDDEYVRESILNPTSTVVAGFAPVMPTFAGRVTEEDLRALIGYLKSLSAPARDQSN